MNFSDAFPLMRQGYYIRRSGWKGELNKVKLGIKDDKIVDVRDNGIVLWLKNVPAEDILACAWYAEKK